MKSLSINGTTFQLIKPRTNKCTMSDVQWILDHVDGSTLFDHYKTVSSAKYNTYKWGERWKRETDGVFAFGVSGGNSFNYIIRACYQDSEYNTYILVITHASNKAYLVSV